MRTSIELRRTLKRISKPHLKSLGLHKLKQHKPWFEEECLHFLDQRKQAKMQWVQAPNQSNADNLNTETCESSRHFRNKRKHIWKLKLRNLKLTVRSKNIRDLYRGISDFKEV